MRKSTLIKSSFIIMFLTLISKLLGLLRESIIAAQMGATSKTDIYFYAMSLTTIIFVAIGGAVSSTFVPILTELIIHKKDEERYYFINNLLNIISLFTLILILLSLIFGKEFLMVLAPGFLSKLSKEEFQLAILVTQIIFISLIFMSWQSIIKSVLNVHRVYSLPAATDIIYNLILVFYFMFLYKKFDLIGLAVASLIAAFFQFIVLVPSYRVRGYKYKFIVDFRDENLIRCLKLVIPILIGIAASQINLLIDRMVATTLESGSVAILNYANKLNLLLYTVVGLAITTVTYTDLSEDYSKKNIESFNYGLNKSLTLMSFFMVPGTILMIILKDNIVGLIYERGAFNEDIANITAMVLAVFAPGMIFYGIKDVLNRAFYALKDTRTPMINSVIGAFINIVGNLILSKYIGIFGLALSTTIASVVITILLIFRIRKETKFNLRIFLKNQSLIFIASIFSGIITYGLLICIKEYFNNFIVIIVCGFVGVVVYLLVMMLSMKDRFWQYVKRIK